MENNSVKVNGTSSNKRSYSRNKSELSSFLLAEYDNLAQAHFKTVDSISEFIKHILTIISIPTVIIVLAFEVNALPTSNGQIISSQSIASEYRILLAIISLIIALVGLMLLCYVINLRMDALLYARSINGIRKYFYDADKELTLSEKMLMRALPQSPQKPKYTEIRFFGPIVFALALINSFYIFLSIFLFHLFGNETSLYCNFNQNISISIIGFIVYVVLHYIIYIRYSNYRETVYMRSNIIGVDIDGVLNLHREQFSQILQKVSNKNINPNSITSIPVRNCSTLGVTGEDETKVFNSPEYWTRMPLFQGSPKILNSLRNAFRMKVYIFTSRPWPNINEMSREENNRIKNNWLNEIKQYYKDVSIKGFHPLQYLSIKYEIIKTIMWKIIPNNIWMIISGRDNNPIAYITKRWLKSNKIKFDNLLIEKAGEHIADPRSGVLNRFTISREKEIRYFVEDDWQKAIKLSFICDVVFLINHPYNQGIKLPDNILRVNSWEELYEQIKVLS